MPMKKNTAGKRTSRPGDRLTDLRSQKVVDRMKDIDRAGKTTTRTTAKHIIAHQRAASRRRNNQGSGE